MNRFKIGILAVALFFAPVLSLSAQTASDSYQADYLPKRWLTDVEVENQYGAPLMKSNPVGEPVITSWEYTDYLVYFEYDRVLHSFRKPRQ